MSGYADYLIRLLEPLRVYDLREQSHSGAEVAVIGGQMDEIAAQGVGQLVQALIPTATEQGLSLWEALLLCAPAATGLDARRQALAALLSISWDGFTPAALAMAVKGCGVHCTIEETGACAPLKLRFPGIYGRPQPWKRVRWILESLLPAHLELIYLFRWITWKETHEKSLTWGQVSGLSWYGWMSNAF